MADLSEITQDVSITDQTTGDQARVVVRDIKRLAVQDENQARELFELGRMFHVTTDIISIGTNNETAFFLLKNLTANTFDFHMYDLFINVLLSNGAIIRLYEDPTVTANGTALTPHDMNGNTHNPASMETYKIPTVTDNGNLVHTWLLPTFATPDMKLNMMGLYSLAPDQSILLTAEDSSNEDISISLVWGEQAR